jgi:hypothetical protein
VSPIDHFSAVWTRCNHLSVIHGFIANNVSPALQPGELLRAEWAARVSALDLYVHELISQRMLSIFEGKRAKCEGYGTFQVPTETMDRIRTAANETEASAAFDLTTRDQLGRKTFQYPEDIAAGVRLFSSCDLWNDVALQLGATQQNKNNCAKQIKQQLKQIVGRRNKIVHEGDLQPGIPRTPWPITQADVAFVSEFLLGTVGAIDAVA